MRLAYQTHSANEMKVAKILKMIVRQGGLPANQPIRHLEVIVPVSPHDGFVTVRVHFAGSGLPVEIPVLCPEDVVLG